MKFRFSEHSLLRMQERGVSREQVLHILKNSVPFRYVHGGYSKLGYYDSMREILVTVAGNTVTTVMARVSERYIQALRKKTL